MRAGTRKYRQGKPDCLISVQKNSVPLIFDGLEYHKYKARQARWHSKTALISEDMFLHYALYRHLLSDRHVVIYPNLDGLPERIHNSGFSLLIIDFRGLTQPLIVVLQLIRHLSSRFPNLRIALLVTRPSPTISKLIAASTDCTLVNRCLPVPCLIQALRTATLNAPDSMKKITAHQWGILEGMSSGKSLAALTVTMNKPYHYGSYQLTRMMQILGISTRAQWLHLLHQLSMPVSVDT